MTYDLLSWALAAFFLLGAAINGVGPAGIRKDYARWGYPSWFRFVTAGLEATTAVLLLSAAWRGFGAALGMLVMAAAVLTTLGNREPRRAIAPFVVLVLCALLAWGITS